MTPIRPAEPAEPAPERHRHEEPVSRREERKGRARANGNERRAALAGTIEAEIVPRLLMSLTASCQALTVPGKPQRGTLNPDDVTELARLLLGEDPQPVSTFVRAIRERGAPLERLCLELFQPAAQRLSELCEQEQCDFTQLTIGLSRLYMVLQQLSGAD